MENGLDESMMMISIMLYFGQGFLKLFVATPNAK